MSAEGVGGVAAAKWLWSAVFAPVLFWLFKKIDNLEEKSYSKDETDKQIKLHVDPIKEEQKEQEKRLESKIDQLSASINVLSNVLTEFRVEVAKMSKGIRDE